MTVGRKGQELLVVTAVLAVVALVAVVADEVRIAIAVLVLLDAIVVAAVGLLLTRPAGGDAAPGDDGRLLAAVERHGEELVAIQRSIDHLAEVVVTEVHAVARAERSPEVP